MEHFDDFPPKGIKEKNMFVFHLDTPRIVILCSVIIGLVAIAFLLGMNLFKPNTKSADLLKDPLYELPLGEKGMDNQLMPPPLNSDDGASSDISNLIAPPDIKSEFQGSKDNTADLLASDKTNKIIPPVKDHIKSGPPAIAPAASKKSASVKKSSEKKHIREVASTKKTSKQPRKKHYAIQVAAFDMRSKAVKEKARLKRMSYDAYIDRHTSRGKNYYRVRIGPIASKIKAIETMNEVQEISRYEESYVVKE